MLNKKISELTSYTKKYKCDVLSFFTKVIIMMSKIFCNAITPNNCFVKGSHKYDVYLVEENKAHLS